MSQRARFFGLLFMTASAVAFGASACNSIPLFGLDHKPKPADTAPPGWNPTYGIDKYFYFWRVTENQAGDYLGRIFRENIQEGGPAELFYAPPDGKCVGCHNVARDGHYLSIVELDTEFGLDPSIHVVDMTHIPPVEVALPGGLPVGTFTSWEPVAVGSSSNRFVFASPNGLQIASVSSGVLMTLTSTTQDGLIPSMPSWGPNDRIYYAAAHFGDSRIVLYQDAEIWSIKSDGTDKQLVYSDPDNMSYFPEISPNGEWLSFTSTPSGADASTFASLTAHVKLMRLSDGTISEPDDLNASTSEGRTWATWSSAGNRLTCGTAKFSNDVFGKHDSDIYEVSFDPETGEDWDAHRIDAISTTEFEHIPRWSP